ncbi:hypothetical protein Ahy_B06g084571 [Arachis hypogaea]|uniref:non-specific serine/threonine protein kinase n=1 Tax=Arachis hypogaea TaxID=3818 RepID=A0A444YS91_ARAHY|nr:hypothetical protein Ahy_B06g084571 [Arachis hypogaea]
MVKYLLDPRILTLALTFLRSNPKSRPSMQQVAHELSTSKHLDLSYNNLTGNLPIELASIPHINLSFNFFECPQGCKNFYAKSMIGNTPLSVNSSIKDQNTEKSGHLGIIALPISCFFLHVIFVGIFCFTRRTKKNRDLFFLWNYDGKIAFEDIIEATQDFDIRYCIATGTYDYVYKVQLSKGKIFALKKLH